MQQKTVRIQLIRKVAAVIDDIDLSSIRVGEIVELPWSAAAVLLAEGWAVVAADPGSAPNSSRHSFVSELNLITFVRCVRLIRKVADIINGVDISKCRVGDLIDVPNAVASMLVREGWAEVQAEEPDEETAIIPWGRPPS